MKEHSRRGLLWLIPLALATFFILYYHDRPTVYQKNSGFVFGTIYNITYQSSKDLHSDIIAELQRFDNSLSTFNPQSIISKINRNEATETDTLFRNVLRRSLALAESTDGAFDITISPLVNVWGFGFTHEQWPDSTTVDSLKALIGYQNIALQTDGRLTKTDPRMLITCDAVAKGYASDVIGNLLARNGIRDYMVEIGGEVVLHGRNPEGEEWRIGINKPTDNSLAVNNDLQLVLQLSDCALATSGNYRNFYYRDGKKYAHTIDPRTGYPVQHSLLSATVVAHDCMTADALATAFMVMGLDDAIAYCEKHPDIDACLIYADENGKYQTHLTEHLKAHIR
ncbi:MAG: FAD:protein FMN transferase [Prevotellaceae bacterium]|nr:FAD:protein FMN transferase [Prevotellaceae bacterium]